MDLDGVADELYALEPAEFTAIRTEREKRARADGDKELARQIHQLRKPTVTAWLANLLARERPDSLQPLTELGTQLQEAQETLRGDALRELSRQRHQVVHALVQEARALASGAGTKVTEQVARELEQTLQAMLADPAAADVVLAGRLTTALQHAGFGPQAVAGPSRSAAARPAAEPVAKAAAKDVAKTAGQPAATKARRPATAGASRKVVTGDDAGERRREAARAAAQRTVDEAEQALQEATGTAVAAEDSADDLEQRQEDLVARIADLQHALTEAEQELSGVRRDARRAQRSRERAAQARERAERALAQARSALG